MERPSGPLGAATQSTGRPMVDNGVPRPAPLSTVRRIPPNTVRHAASSSSISAGQFVALAKEAMRNALHENQTKAAEASGVSNELKPGVTIDLSHKQIQRFPDEVVDIIKNELERYFLSLTSSDHWKQELTLVLDLHCHIIRSQLSHLGSQNALLFGI